MEQKLITFVLIILLFISQAIAQSNFLNNFIDCLSDHSNNFIPINASIYYGNTENFSYILQSHIRNERFNQSSAPKPLAIVTALHQSHVQATVICSKAYGLNLRIRSGGHDYEGLSYVSYQPFVVLDMFNLRAIDIDVVSETAWVGAGATLGQLYYKIANSSKTLAFAGGVCPTLGLGGHISGGGYGNLMRKYGLSVDNVIDAKIVDVNGNILDRNTMGDDLFWAIRGGGGASFGVVISWKLKLVQVPEIVTVFNVKRTLEQGGTDVLDQWQRVATKIDPNLFIRAQIKVVDRSEDGKKTVQVSFIALYLGRANQLTDLVSKKFPSLGLKLQDCIETSWVESTLYWSGSPVGTPTESLLATMTKGLFSKYKSDYVQKPISKAGFEAIWKKLLEVEVVSLKFNPYGGKMSEISCNETPFPHRAGNLFKIQYTGEWTQGDEKVTRRYLEALKRVYDFFTPFVSKNPREQFLNYRDIDIGTNEYKNTSFAYQYFKENLERLLVTKAKVDPENFFTYEQSIPVIPSLL